MPELPDIVVYLDALRPRVVGRTLTAARIKSPFLVRTFEPDVEAAVGLRVRDVSRIGKRIVLRFDGELHYVFHLMIAGRFLWKPPGTRPAGKIDVAAFEFEGEVEGGVEGAGATDGAAGGTLLMTEASPKKRASLHVVLGRDGLAAQDPGGLEPLECGLGEFAAAMQRENRTIKRALTDPRTLSGVGNAHSDEILFRARLSPVKLTRSIDMGDFDRLFLETRAELESATDLLRQKFGIRVPGRNRYSDGTEYAAGIGRFPGAGDITAFRPEFAVHGKYGKPCPVCGSPVQRIVRGENETNYCATCQTGGKLLADRSLSRLLKDDWPATVEEWEEVVGGGCGSSKAAMASTSDEAAKRSDAKTRGGVKGSGGAKGTGKKRRR